MGAKTFKEAEPDKPDKNGLSCPSVKKGFVLKYTRKQALTPPAPLTDEQKDLIVKSWGDMKDEMTQVGVVVFIGLFETHPDVQEVFYNFKGVAPSDLHINAELRAHGLRVLTTIDKVITRIEEPEKMATVLVQLGRRHKGYSSKPEFMDFIAPQLLGAILKSLKDRDVATEDAWSSLVKIISYYMKRGLIEEECNKLSE